MKQYLDFLRLILAEGVEKEDRTGTGTKSVFGVQMRFPLQAGFPLVTTKRVYFKGVVEELLWFLKGDTNISYLQRKQVKIWDQWADEQNNLGPVYSALWRRWPVKSNESVVIPQRVGPAAGPVEVPDHVDVTPLPSEYEGDLPIEYVNGDQPFRLIKELGTLGGKNTQYLIQFTNTGNIAQVSRPNLRSGTGIKDVYHARVLDVACIGRPRKEFDSSVYDLWHNMVARCYNQNHPSYPLYGALGVYVSPRWLCFENFLNDISCLPYYEEWCQQPFEYDLDKDYFGSNCYDVTTTLFVDKVYNKALSHPLRPMQATSPKGQTFLFSMRDDLVKFLGISDETLRNFEKGVYDKSRLKGWVITDYTPPEGMLIRRKLYIDQIGELLHNLKTKPFSRRHLVSGWNPELLPDETLSPVDNARRGKQALPPCHTLYQFMVEPINLMTAAPYYGISIEGRLLSEVRAEYDARGLPKLQLSCQLYQRSGDAMLGIPFNIASYALLTMMIAQVSGMAPGTFIHTVGDAHIYKNHLEQVDLQLSREPRPLPTMRLNPDVTDLFAFCFDDFTLENYQPHAHISAPVAV